MHKSSNLSEIVIDAAQDAVIGTSIDYHVDKGNYEGQIVTCSIDNECKLNVSNEIDPLVYTVKGIASCDGEYLDYDGITHTKDHNLEIEVRVTIMPVSYDGVKNIVSSGISTDVITASVVET